MFVQWAKNLVKKSALYNRYVDRLDAKKETAVAVRRAGFVDRVLPKNAVGAELGVFKGYFSPVLIDGSRAKVVHLIDPWYLDTSHWHWGYGNRSTVRAVINILRRFEKQIEAGQVRVHIGDDLQVLATFPDGYFDWVYIDSTHAYEHTKRELDLLVRKMKPDGVIAGDDWRPDPTHPHHGYKAVTEFVAGGLRSHRGGAISPSGRSSAGQQAGSPARAGACHDPTRS